MRAGIWEGAARESYWTESTRELRASRRKARGSCGGLTGGMGDWHEARDWRASGRVGVVLL